jgi:uracil-DNA glycosylase
MSDLSLFNLFDEEQEDVNEVIKELSHTCNSCRLSVIHPMNQGMTQRGNPKAKIAVIAEAPGDTELMDVNVPIPTPSGWVKNGDLKTADQIFGQDGKIYNVLDAHPIKEEPIYRVFFDDNTSVDVHAGHLWTTKNRYERRKGKIGSVKRTDKILQTINYKEGNSTRANHSIDLCKAVELPEKGLLIHPYVLGCWLGDGNSANNGFTTVDPEILIRMQEVAQISNKLWKTSEGKAPVYALEILGSLKPIRNAYTGKFMSGYNFMTELKSLGVLNNKHIPKNYLWSSKEQRLELLRGLMDTNGCATQRGQCKFSNTNKSIVDGVYQLACSLGIKATIVGPILEKAKYSKVTKKWYQPTIAIYDVLWSSNVPVFGLKRKADRLPKENRSTVKKRYITNIQILPENKQMRCLTVDNPTGLYLFGHNFNVTHNTERGIPLVGRSGQEFEKWMKHIGLNPRTDMWISNVIQCFPGESLVSATKIDGAFRRFYTGPMIRIKTTVSEFSGTPNHPILTQRGWIPLNALKNGDQLVNSKSGGDIMFTEPQITNVPTKFVELFSSLLKLGNLKRVIGSSEDFHSDGINSEVDIIDIDRVLRNTNKSSFFQKSLNFFLKPSNKTVALLSRFGLRHFGILDPVRRPFILQNIMSILCQKFFSFGASLT